MIDAVYGNRMAIIEFLLVCLLMAWPHLGETSRERSVSLSSSKSLIMWWYPKWTAQKCCVVFCLCKVGVHKLRVPAAPLV